MPAPIKKRPTVRLLNAVANQRRVACIAKESHDELDVQVLKDSLNGKRKLAALRWPV